MRTLDRDTSGLLVVDLQARLMPAIDGAAEILRHTGLLLAAARQLTVPVLFTEQNPAGLGRTAPELQPGEVLTKMHFDACREAAPILPDRPSLVVLGCEAHVCVLQTVLGLLDQGRRVHVVANAVGSRTPANKDAALRRMAAHGAEIVTTEMVVFEWLGTAAHPAFRDLLRLVK